MEVKLQLKPFTVPNFVLVEGSPRPRQEGFREGRKFRLSELDESTLEEMCNEFRASVMAKAGVKT